MSVLLVTGGAGFIGSRVVAAAAAAGWSVRVLDSLSTDVHSSPPVVPDGVELVRADITDARALDACLRGVDVVSHQAAKVGMGVDVTDAPDYVRANVLGTGELIAALARAEVSRIVLASSMVVYGEGHYIGTRGDVRPGPRDERDLRAGMFEPRDPLHGGRTDARAHAEDAPIDPRSIYAVSKLAQEQLVQVWANRTGGRAAMLRYHNVYGPGMPRDTPYAGVAAIFRSSLERGLAPQVLKDGGQRRDFIHVDDVAAANLRAIDWTADAPPATARPFNVGSGRMSTILEVAQQLSRAHGGLEPVVTGQFRAGDVRHITASSARARAAPLDTLRGPRGRHAGVRHGAARA